MTDFTIASFNVKNLIEAEQEYYRFEQYTPEEHAWKQSWLADQILNLSADIVCFQEIFTEEALRATIAEADAIGMEANKSNIPDPRKRYARKAIFRKLAYEPYTDAALAFAPNSSDGGPGERRPGVAVLSRFGFVGEAEIIQDLETPLDIPFTDLGGGDGGTYKLSRLSRPILKVRVPVGDQVITVFNCHLKSKLGELDRPEGAPFPPAADLVNYDPSGRALGALRAGLRRMAEAWVLRARDMVYTSAFGGVFESIDQILMSRHFHPDDAQRIGEMEYFSVLNDHLTDGSHSEAPYNKLASDHGQIMAHMRLGRTERD